MSHVLRRLLLLQAVLLLLMGAARAAFYWVHGDPAARASERADWGAAALLGARFDLLVLAYLALPALLALLVLAARGRSGGPARWLTLARHWFFWGFLLVALISLADFFFYEFYQDRLNVMIFGFFEDHTVAVLSSIWDMFPVPAILLGAAAFGWLLWKLTRRLLQPAVAPAAWGGGRARAVGAALLILVAAAVAARGSLGKFPLRARMASVSPHAFVNLCVLNGPFALKEAIAARLEEDATPLAPRLGFPTLADAAAALLERPAPSGLDAEALVELLRARAPRPPERAPAGGGGSPAPASEAAPHVVLVLMESLGSQLLRYQSPDFNLLGSFARHLPRGWSFRCALPEANGTIGTVTALATGLPNRPNTTYLSQSRFADVALPTAPARFFAAGGYETLFLYGGHASWRKIDRFLPRQGFARVEGLPAIHQALGLTEADQAWWKTHDANTFRYLRESLRAAERPTYALVLTATNHPPFEWLERFGLPALQPPTALQASLKPGAVEGRMRGIQYSLQQLGDFLDGLEADGTLARTIVAVTGDHNTFDYANYGEADLFDRFGVPLWLWVPEAWRPAAPPDLDAPIGHLDLAATLMHLALPAGAWAGLGDSAFDPARAARVFHQEETEAWTVGERAAVQEGVRGLRRWRRDPADALRLVPNPGGAEHEALQAWARARLGVADHLLRILAPAVADG